jgi:hypothetical protein
MSYWYGSLYVVVEGYQELKFSDPVLDKILKSPNVELLRKYRNGTFHYQKTYFDHCFEEFVKQGIESAVWIHNVSEQLGRFFLEESKRRGVGDRSEPQVCSTNAVT